MDIAASPTLAFGVLTASLLGSLHCAAMCGGFACLYGSDSAGAPSTPSGATKPRLTGHVAYHGGRLAAYASLGAIAGALGASLDQFGALSGVQRTASIVTGALLLVWGAALLAQAFNVRVLPALVGGAVPEGAARLMGSALLLVQQRTVAVRALMLGVLTGLMPCGWLYAFVVTAAGTGSALRGAAFMTLFWLGTVPALVAVAIGMRRASGRLQRSLPVVSALIVIGFGIASLGSRIGAAAAHASHNTSSAASSATPSVPHAH
jgi:sulfite exporter TauE/SafE